MINNKKINKIFLIVTIVILVILNIFMMFKFYNLNKGVVIHEEIERKWLINFSDVPYDLSDSKVKEIYQSYIAFGPEMRLRNINNGESYILTIKSNMSSDGLVRDEVEYDISEEEYNYLLTKKDINSITIHKTRYQFKIEDYFICIDKFHNEELEGLAYMEIEFESEESANNYINPDWVIEDVTSDIRYKNGHIAKYGIPE